MKVNTAIFDMDGTVLDTLGDLTDSMNHVMAIFGHRSDFSEAEAAFFFGSGSAAAVRRALSLEAGIPLTSLYNVGLNTEELSHPFCPEERQIFDGFRSWYRDHCTIKTAPYEGIIPAIKALRAAGIKTALVSNKPDRALQILAKEYFPGLFDYCSGQRGMIPVKPAPDMLIRAIKDLRTTPEDCVYIGDSEIDLAAAKNAGIRCISAAWGFRSVSYLISKGAEIIAKSPREILFFLIPCYHRRKKAKDSSPCPESVPFHL